MMNKNLYNLILIFCLTICLTNIAFASEETLETLKAKEDNILAILAGNKNLKEKQEQEDSKKFITDDIVENTIVEDTNVIIDKELIINKELLKSDSSLNTLFLRRIAKRKELRKQIALKRDLKLNPRKLSAPIIIASNRLNTIDADKINADLNKCIKKADLVLKESKKDTSKRAISKEYFTISTDYFDEDITSDDASYVYVTDDVSLHTLPSLSSKLIYLVKANTRLKLDKNHGAWYRVKSADNKYGWILGDMLNFSSPNSFSTLKNKGIGF